MNKLARQIKEARQAAGYTQEEIAEQIGISRSAVARWETGDIKPTIDNLASLAILLNVSADYLLGIGDKTISIKAPMSDKARLALEAFIAEIRK